MKFCVFLAQTGTHMFVQEPNAEVLEEHFASRAALGFVLKQQAADLTTLVLNASCLWYYKRFHLGTNRDKNRKIIRRNKGQYFKYLYRGERPKVVVTVFTPVTIFLHMWQLAPIQMWCVVYSTAIEKWTEFTKIIIEINICIWTRCSGNFKSLGSLRFLFTVFERSLLCIYLINNTVMWNILK